ncbi:LysR family transcriptional regulator of gallate degradation [Paraburkholderia sp. JPY158]|uniref:LysR family transcriptional regulator of gallate degradation n=1 Tax=Paraburkholderia atlantica TaxID=2654982 RepID=A0A7W8V476_PARAM|nr:LysR family transcriptional regulator [Paraburkholderia atlantica]MBB5422546.1 LysR family transcriptional regulator of gallate degradation [Paraburkholderia atlantica]
MTIAAMPDRAKITPQSESENGAGAALPGLAMDPRKLLYMVTAIEQGSLSKAAKKLSISQPALTKSMDRLEHELGMQLLTRTPTGIIPTPLGELVYSHAKLIRDEIDLAETRLRADSAATNVVTVGTLPSIASRALPLAVARWKAQVPNVMLRVIERRQVDLLLGLFRREFDFVIAQTEFFDIFPEGLKQRVLFRDRLCVFARPDHYLFGLVEPSWADLARFPWVSPMIGWHQRAVFEKLVEAEGVPPPQQFIECGSIEFTKTLVAESDHLALLPAHSTIVEVKEGSIKVLPITFPALKRNIAVIFRETAPLNDMHRDFIAHLEAVGKELCTE